MFTREAIAQGNLGRTSLRLPDPLAAGRTYYWRGRAEDGANTGPYSSPANFNLIIPIVIGQPVPVSPVSSSTVSNLHPRFTFTNAPITGPVGAVSYTVEIATTDTFANKAAIWSVAQQASQTNLDAPADLSYSQTYFWHVRAYDPTVTGPWSTTESFKTGAAPVVVTPTPTPGTGAPPGTPCGPPWPGSQLGIVSCRRAQYGHMSASEMVAFLKGVARDLNAAGFAGGPFGILLKSGGGNCNGYSCDIICTNAGVGFDVLSDSDGAQNPSWGGPIAIPNSCEIQ